MRVKIVIKEGPFFRKSIWLWTTAWWRNFWASSR